MVSQEFRSAVEERNLLRTRIMLKDSLVIDPSFNQFNELLAYARMRLPDIVEPFDGELLENNSSMWNSAEMDRQLVKLVNNFSEKRIQYVKAIVSKVRESDIKKVQDTKQTVRNTKDFSRISDKYVAPAKSRKEKRQNALRQLTVEIRRMDRILDHVSKQGEWRMGDVYDIENAANRIITATQDYKKNK